MRGCDTFLAQASVSVSVSSEAYQHMWPLGISLPIRLGPAPGIHQVFDGEAVELLVLAEGPDDVPAEAVDVDPATLNPVGLGRLEEFNQTLIVQLLDVEIVDREIDDGDLAFRLGLRHGRVSPVGSGRVDAWFRARSPPMTRLEVVEVSNGLHGAGAHRELREPARGSIPARLGLGPWGPVKRRVSLSRTGT